MIDNLKNGKLTALFLLLMTLAFVPACSSTEEAPPPGESSSSGGLEDCSVYTSQVDISECEMRNKMRD